MLGLHVGLDLLPYCSSMAWRWRIAAWRWHGDGAARAGACPSVGRVGSSMMQQQQRILQSHQSPICKLISATLDFRTPSALISQGREQSACRSTSAFSSVHVTYCTVGQEVPRQMLLCTRYRRGRHYMYLFHRVARGPITEREAHRQQLWPCVYSGAAPRNHQPLAGGGVLVETAKLVIPGTLVTLMASASTMTTIRTAPAPVVHHRHRYQP